MSILENGAMAAPGLDPTLLQDDVAPDAERLDDPRDEVVTSLAGLVGEHAGVEHRRPSIVESDPERYESLSPAGDVFRKVLDHKTREVIVESEISLAHYDELAEQLGPWAVRDMAYARRLAEPLQGVHIEEVNPTANGGGVQMILMAQINMMRRLGVDDRWRLMNPNEQAFRVTKDWHNTFQGVAQHTIGHIDAGKTIYESWIEDENVEALREPLSEADIVTIHDPQPHGLIPHVREWNPTAPIPWRSHIQNRTDLIATPGSPQERVWDYIYTGKVDQADAHIFHPVDAFVPGNVPEATVKFGPATFDPFDDLNRLNLTEDERVAGREFIDGQLATSHVRKPETAPEEEDWTQTEVDWDRPIMALIARFDPSKGMPEALLAYNQARQTMVERGVPEAEIPQLVIIGNGSIDDPDGEGELARMMGMRSGLDETTKGDVKVIRVPHNDTAINTLMTEAEFGLQPSTVEGFETRASDWIWHGKPVIVSNRGGLPLQVHEGKSGHIVDPEDIDAFAERMVQMSTDQAKYREMCAWAEDLGKTYNYREFSTVANTIRWLELYANLRQGGELQGGRKWRISEIVDGEVSPETRESATRVGALAMSAE